MKDKANIVEITALARNQIFFRNKKGDNLTLLYQPGSQGQNEQGYYVDFKIKKALSFELEGKNKTKKYGWNMKDLRFYKDPKAGN